jgi:hypothetical protein
MPAAHPSSLPSVPDVPADCLETFGAGLRALGQIAHVFVPPGRVRGLIVQSPQAARRYEQVRAASDGATGQWRFWSGWEEPVTPAGALAAAGGKVTRILARCEGGMS